MEVFMNAAKRVFSSRASAKFRQRILSQEATVRAAVDLRMTWEKPFPHGDKNSTTRRAASATAAARSSDGAFDPME
jgi:hypothetical protein